MTELFRHELFSLVADDGFARVIRSGVASASAAEMQAVYDHLVTILRRSGMRRLLVDLRGGPPGRNDPEFERAGDGWRRHLATDYDRVALLVRTAAGKLQVQRLGREVGRAPSIFMDEAEAIAFLK